ncbi:ankyrin repeat-containing domain protein [Xylaria grammica]|nr:ankyrin repeat-containing domain protein [Xylaria grammica]
MDVGSSTTLGYTDSGWLGDGIISLGCDHGLNDDLQLALTGLQETLHNDQNNSSLGLWHQGQQSELQADIQSTSGIELPLHSKVLFSSHFTGFEELLCAKSVSFIRPGRAGLGKGLPLFGGLTSKFIADVVLSKQQALTRKASDLNIALSRFGALIPGENTTLIPGDDAFETNFARILLFSMLNGFAGLNHIPSENMLKFLGRLSIINRSFLTALKECWTPAARTFVDTAFRASIEAKDDSALKQLLKHHLVDVNETICIGRREKYTPIERAASLLAYNLIPTLLQYGADPNNTRVGIGRGGALEKLIQGLSPNGVWASTASITATKDITETIDLLVRAGAIIIPRDMLGAGNIFTTYDIAYRLSLAILPSDHRDFFIERHPSIITFTVQRADDTQASQLIQNMMNLCETAGCNNCLAACTSSVEEAAIEAARTGRLKVVRLLIDHVPSPTKLLCAAIRSNRKDLIDFVLSFNPNLDPSAQHLEPRFRRQRTITTPLAEAVKMGNTELIHYLHAGGAFSRLNKGGRMKALMLAAARWGNISFMRQILSYSNSSSHPRRAEVGVVSIALQNGHEEVARLLLESGPKAVWDKYERGSPLGIALASQNKSLVHAILNAEICWLKDEHFCEAFKWGDMSIVADLISACPPSHLSSQTLWNLCLRCMQDDNTGFFRHFVELHKGTGLLGECLQGAVRMGHSEMVCYLLDIGVNPFTDYVLEATLTGHKEMLHLLFGKTRPRRAIPKCIGARVISSVMDESLGSPQALEALMETRAVNLIATEEIKRESYAVTPLGLALVSLSKTPDKDPWMVRMLLDAGSDPNGVAKTFRGKIAENHTGLMVALETNRREIVQLLIDSGADVSLKPCFALKRTPLQYAAELGHLDMVRMLLEQGAEVNAGPAIRGGGTALQFAAISGNCNIANELLVNDALLGARPSKIEGRWPLEGAAEHGRLDMIQFLWAATIAKGGSNVVDGFERRHCLRAMNFARRNGHLGCRDLVSDLSGIPVDRLDVEDYGASWLAYSDPSYSLSSSDGDTFFPIGGGERVDDDCDGDTTYSGSDYDEY